MNRKVRIVSGYGLFLLLWVMADQIWTFHPEARVLAFVILGAAIGFCWAASQSVADAVLHRKTAKIEAEIEAAKRQFQLEAEQRNTYAAADDLSRPIEDVIRDAEKRAAK